MHKSSESENYQYDYNDELNNQEIDFDNLMNDVVMAEAEYEEDREDQFEDDDED